LRVLLFVVVIGAALTIAGRAWLGIFASVLFGAILFLLGGLIGYALGLRKRR